MKNIKYIIAVLAAGAVLSACSEEEKYTKGAPEQENTYDVYFPTQTVTDYELDPTDESASTVTVTVKRANTSGAITVPITIEQAPDTTAFVFTATEVSFEDGEDETTFQISFPDALIGVEYICHVLVDDPAYAKVYSYNPDQPAFLSFKFIKVSWTTIATGTYKSWYFGDKPGVELQKCDQNDKALRLLNPFLGGDGCILALSIIGDAKEDEDGETYYNLALEPQFTGYMHPSYGEMFVQDVAAWQGNAAYRQYNLYYPSDGWIDIWDQYYVSAGSFGYNDDYFEPDAE